QSVSASSISSTPSLSPSASSFFTASSMTDNNINNDNNDNNDIINSVNDNNNNNSNTIAVSQAIANTSMFDKGLSDGQRDAMTVVAHSTTAGTATMAATQKTMTSDDVDCEAPDNVTGQASIDYCRGYEKGFAEQNNLMAGK
ncbi:MAG TPA: hypothetical protein VE619_03360, partial [Nitrososphaeraceae archaeon]|nr:hypothetical protein [Nitrososphaeraceae archaeon]